MDLVRKDAVMNSDHTDRKTLGGLGASRTEFEIRSNDSYLPGLKV